MKDISDSVSNASSINNKLAEAASKEFFWGCELSKEKPTVQWNFSEEEDDQDFLQHTLFLRHAILGKSVVKDEKNIVEIETQNFAGDDVKQPILSLTSGKSDMCQLDLNFSHELPVTFRLVEGSGPVFLSAQQLVEFPKEIEEDEFLTATDTETELDEENDEEEEEVEDMKGKKRKANGVSTGSKKKRGKLDSEAPSNGTESDEVDEEDEDDEEEDEDDEEEMETDEEEEDEEEESEDEDEEESPKKKSAKSKKGRPSAGSAKAAKKPKAKAKAKKPAGKKGKAK